MLQSCPFISWSVDYSFPDDNNYCCHHIAVLIISWTCVCQPPSDYHCQWAVGSILWSLLGNLVSIPAWEIRYLKPLKQQVPLISKYHSGHRTSILTISSLALALQWWSGQTDLNLGVKILARFHSLPDHHLCHGRHHHPPVPATQGGIMVLYEQQESTSPTVSLGLPHLRFLVGPPCTVNQPMGPWRVMPGQGTRPLRHKASPPGRVQEDSARHGEPLPQTASSHLFCLPRARHAHLAREGLAGKIPGLLLLASSVDRKQPALGACLPLLDWSINWDSLYTHAPKPEYRQMSPQRVHQA